MTTTHNMTMPPALTRDDIVAARRVLYLVLHHNPDLLPHIKTEAATAMVLFNELAPPVPLTIGQVHAAGPIEAAMEDAIRLVGDDQAIQLLAIELVSRLLVRPEALRVIAGELSDLDDIRNGTGIGQK